QDRLHAAEQASQPAKGRLGASLLATDVGLYERGLTSLVPLDLDEVVLIEDGFESQLGPTARFPLAVETEHRGQERTQRAPQRNQQGQRYTQKGLKHGHRKITDRQRHGGEHGDSGQPIEVAVLGLDEMPGAFLRVLEQSLRFRFLGLNRVPNFFYR